MRPLWIVLAAAGLWQQARAQQVALVRTEDLRHGSLTVWVVTRATHSEHQRIALARAAPLMVAPSTYVEKTASELGRSAADFGQTAGSYGQTSGSFGTSASDTGQTAGSAGKGPSELGQTAGSYGQTAGSYGKTAAEFGRSTSDINNAPVQAPANATAVALQQEFFRDGLAAFEDLQVRIVQVVDEEVRERLAAAEKTASYPDVILDTDLLPWWRDGGAGLVPLGIAPYREESGVNERLHEARLAVILRRAPHPRQARAFVVFLREEVALQQTPETCFGCAALKVDAALEAPIRVARAALASVLQGGGLGAAGDRDAAIFNSVEARSRALGLIDGMQAGELQTQMEVSQAFGNQRLAVVGLRTIVMSAQAFGVLHAMVVLRQQEPTAVDRGGWRVLQLTPNEGASRLEPQTRALQAAAGSTAKAPRGLGVSLAAPVEGDVRPALPELWWDNNGGAAVQVVEWQRSLAASAPAWAESALMPVPDGDPRLQTRVVARFASEAGFYRWRVWSAGPDGVVVLSPWRTLTILGQ